MTPVLRWTIGRGSPRRAGLWVAHEGTISPHRRFGSKPWPTTPRATNSDTRETPDDSPVRLRVERHAAKKAIAGEQADGVPTDDPGRIPTSCAANANAGIETKHETTTQAQAGRDGGRSDFSSSREGLGAGGVIFPPVRKPPLFLTLRLIVLLVAPACKEPPRPEPVAPPEPVRVDDATAKSILNSTKTLMESKPEQIAAADQAKAADASKLHGTWRVRHTIHSTNGEKSAPAAPLAPTRWTFEKNGGLEIAGPMKIDGRYVYTGKTIIISALGPKATYDVEKLEGDELRVVTKIEAGTLRIANTTVLDREK